MLTGEGYLQLDLQFILWSLSPFKSLLTDGSNVDIGDERHVQDSRFVIFFNVTVFVGR